MLLLRLFGPVLVVVTLVMLFSGVGLVVGAPRSLHPRLSQIHHASFLLWFLVTTVHVLGHLKETLSVASRDFIRGARRRVNGSAMRAWTTLASVAVGIACGWAIVPYVGNVSILSH
jgi:succinate dehydrogenase hydrophobic anchor subunit